MLRVKVLRQFLNGDHIVHEGEMITATPERARDLERNRLVTMTIGGAMREPAGSEAAKGGAADPIVSPPPGGPIGEAKPASSRRPAPRRKTRPLTSRAAAAAASR